LICLDTPGLAKYAYKKVISNQYAKTVFELKVEECLSWVYLIKLLF